ncbi:MAG: pentapeptide repeat-containing protein [Thermosynechococcaceae cyanobacterium MS004]|nr:pentapeptide repeat-containing protein [Thermosynechococcaceae cyanobacterium MS004]
MIKTLTFTMAATFRASIKGLQIIDEARRKKGWAKSEKAWADLSFTSVPTLKRFWAGVAIQATIFKDICKEVGISDWESIADFEEKDELTNQVSSKRKLSILLEANFEGTDKELYDQTIKYIQKLVNDPTIRIVSIEEGSIKLVLDGSPEGLKRIEALFESGRLTEVSGISVLDVHFLDKDELVRLIRKDREIALNLRGANLSGTDLRGANLSGTDLSEADLSGTDLSEADLSEADLSGTDLRGADLSGANLRSTRIDERTNFDGKWRLVWEVVNQSAKSQSLSGANLSGANLSGANKYGIQHATVSDAAKEFGVTTKTVNQWINKGILPKPPTMDIGTNTMNVFPKEYLDNAKKALQEYRQRKRLEKQKREQR